MSRNYARFLAVAGGLTLGTAARANTDGEWQWAASGGGAGDDRVQAVAIDPAGNAVITGYITGNASFGGIVLPPAANSTLKRPFAAQYKSDGTLVWAKPLVAFGSGSASPLAISSTGDIYSGLIKCTPNGDVTDSNWPNISVMGPGSDLRLEAIAIDNSGLIAIAGHYSGLCQFGTNTQLNATSPGIFLALYSADGQVQRARGMFGLAFTNRQPVSLCSSGDGGFWLGGTITAPVNFGPAYLQADETGTAFVMRISRSGNTSWAGALAVGDLQGNLPSVKGLATDSRGHLVATGSGSHDANRRTTGAQYVSEFTPTGGQEWFIPIQNASVTGLGVAPHDQIVIGGTISNTATFGTNQIVSQATADLFLARYDTNGSLLNLRKAGSQYDPNPGDPLKGTYASALAIDGLGNPFLAGYFYSATDFDGIHLTGTNAANLPDTFVAKWDVAPRIILDPASKAARLDQSISFRVSTAGATPQYYQWLRNGTPIIRATNAVFTIGSVTANDEADYQVQVSNSAASVTSLPAHLYIIAGGLEIISFPRVTVVGIPGKTYAIQASSAPGSAPWVTVTNITLASQRQSWIDQESGASSKQFYRVVPLP